MWAASSISALVRVAYEARVSMISDRASWMSAAAAEKYGIRKAMMVSKYAFGRWAMVD